MIPQLPDIVESAVAVEVVPWLGEPALGSAGGDQSVAVRAGCAMSPDSPAGVGRRRCRRRTSLARAARAPP